MDAEELARKIARYKPYFGEQGGVTFSGGEPLLQSEFLEEMIPLLQKEGIGYIVDTSGAVALTDSVRSVLCSAQSVLLDLKFWDDESYLRYTGRSIDKTLSMLRYLNEIGKKTRVRIVVIPEINDREEILERYLKHLRGMNCISGVELLAFHTMGFFKYEGLGIPNPLEKTHALSQEVKDRLQAFVDRTFHT
jgi:pyruvate formate lyase activating enzyme